MRFFPRPGRHHWYHRRSRCSFPARTKATPEARPSPVLHTNSACLSSQKSFLRCRLIHTPTRETFASFSALRLRPRGSVLYRVISTDTTPPTGQSISMEKTGEATIHGSIRLFHNSPPAQLFPRSVPGWSPFFVSRCRLLSGLGPRGLLAAGLL